jgi:hypothetical protein
MNRDTRNTCREMVSPRGRSYSFSGGLPPGQARRGITLIELMMGLSLFMVLMMLSAVFFTSAWRTFHARNALQDAQNNAIMGIDRFGRDFKETTVVNVINYTDSSTAMGDRYIYFPSPRDIQGNYAVLPSGDPDWQTWMIYSLAPDPDDSSVFIFFRKRKAGSPAFPPSLSDINDRRGAQVAARFVMDFTVTQAATSGSAYSYNAVIQTRRTYKNDKFSFNTEKFFTFTSP